MAFFHTLASNLRILYAVSALPASAHSSNGNSKRNNIGVSSFRSFFSTDCSILMENLSRPPSAVGTDTGLSSNYQSAEDLPDLLTEFMVDMKCEGCVNSVKNKLQTLDGVKNVEVDLSNQIVKIFGSSPVMSMAEAIEQTGRKARLIGQGMPHEFAISAAVAEFKGPTVFGVVRFAQVSMETARVEANFSGLTSKPHALCINEYGDLTNGALSTGKMYNPANSDSKEPVGDLGKIEGDEKGAAHFSVAKRNLRVADLIGRSVVVYEEGEGIAAAVIARSAGVGENYKKICSCDGTVIWESSTQDFVSSKF